MNNVRQNVKTDIWHQVRNKVRESDELEVASDTVWHDVSSALRRQCQTVIQSIYVDHAL